MFIFVFTLLTFVYCRAQTVQAVPYAIRQGVYVADARNVLATFANQAALANVSSLSGGVYGEKRFLMQELGLYHAGVVLPTQSGNFGLQAVYFGNSNYNEAKLGIAYGRKLGEKLRVGGQFNYINYAIAGYGNSGAITIEAGLLFRVSEQLTAGLHINNPSRSSFLKQAEEQLPVIVSGGLGYKASDKFFVSAEMVKTEDRPIDILPAVQYNFDEKLFAKLGTATATSTYYFGGGVVLKEFCLQALATVHPQLGITPGLMLTYKKQ